MIEPSRTARGGLPLPARPTGRAGAAPLDRRRGTAETPNRGDPGPPHPAAAAGAHPPTFLQRGRPMSKQLLVIEGPDQGRVFPLAGKALVVGSSNKNTDICLSDPYVSRLHCKVELEDDRVVVSDLKNSKGTFVNGTQVTRQELHPGDVLRVGNSQLRLEVEAATVLPPDAHGVV